MEIDLLIRGTFTFGVDWIPLERTILFWLEAFLVNSIFLPTWLIGGSLSVTIDGLDYAFGLGGFCKLTFRLFIFRIIL